jgi:hypothetical protein
MHARPELPPGRHDFADVYCVMVVFRNEEGADSPWQEMADRGFDADSHMSRP